MEHKIFKISILVIVLYLVTVFLLDNDGTFPLFAGFIGVSAILDEDD